MASEGRGVQKLFVKVFSFARRPEFLLGGFLFWLPDVAYHYVARGELSKLAVWALSIGMPLVVACIYPLGMMWARGRGRSPALSILGGIWAFGPFMIMLGQTFAGAGFKSGLAGEFAVVIAATVVPFFTLLLSGYDLTVFGLLAATILLVVMHVTFEKRVL